MSDLANVDQASLESLEKHLTGRSIVSVGMDVRDAGFHLCLDDGNVLMFVCEGPYVVGVFKAVPATLQ